MEEKPIKDYWKQRYCPYLRKFLSCKSLDTAIGSLVYIVWHLPCSYILPEASITGHCWRQDMGLAGLLFRLCMDIIIFVWQNLKFQWHCCRHHCYGNQLYCNLLATLLKYIRDDAFVSNLMEIDQHLFYFFTLLSNDPAMRTCQARLVTGITCRNIIQVLY